MTRAARRPAPPWWAEAGPDDEPCPLCYQSYAYEIEVRCVDCDCPLCPACVVVERVSALVHLCPGCSDARAAAPPEDAQESA